MNQSFTVALDKPAGERNFEIFAGDDFAVTLRAFETDSPADINPVDLSGAALTLYVDGPYWPAYSIVGVPGESSVFTFPAAFSGCRGSRIEYRVALALGLSSSVIMHGTVVVKRDHYGYPAGFLDYGWWWPL